MKTLLSAVVAATLAFAAVEVGAADNPQERQVSLTIESKTLAEALDQWAQQTGFQILVPNWEMTKKISAPRLLGTYSARDALNRLLEGTPLTGVWTTDKAVTIREKKQADWQTIRTIEGGGVRRLLQATDDGPGGSGRSDAGSGAGSASDAESQSSVPGWRQQSVEHNENEVRFLEHLVVTGSHIRGVNNTSPVTVLSRAYIESTGATTTSRLIESLPQNFALTSQSGVLVPGSSDTGEQGSSINLRAVGEGTTLVLLNGRRMALGFLGGAADISALPVSAIERVEVLTDGASALYGADAVGGVVNFILRDDFEGAETRLSTGRADSVNEYGMSQAVGGTWSSGHALVSMEYYKRDLLAAEDRDFVPQEALIGSLLPRDENYSVLFSGRQQLTDATSLFADTLYMNRDSYNRAGQVTLGEESRTDNPQVAATLGLDASLGRDWQLEVSGSYARNKLSQERHSDSDFVGGASDTDFQIRSARVKTDGALFALTGGEVRAAIGGDWRSESFEYVRSFERDVAPPTSQGRKQTVRSLFGELYVPIVGSVNAITGVRRLDLSLAARLDDYSNFGSSFDPRYGVSWEIVRGLRLRGSYGTSYVAPKLIDYNLGGNLAVAVPTFDPGSPTFSSHQLQVFGIDVAGLSAQESESSSVGLEFQPQSIEGIRIGLNYYRIDYDGRIASPPLPDVILGNPSSFGGLFIRNPSVQQVSDYIAVGQLGNGFLAFNEDFTENTSFDPSTIELIVDNRRRNLSALKTSGVDLSFAYHFAAAGADIHVGLAGTYILEIEQRVTVNSQPFDTVDTFFNPPDWRARAALSWERGGWAADLFVNHTDSYTDNRGVAPAAVSSYTTADVRLGYAFGARIEQGFLSGVTVSASVQNLFDREPPNTAIIRLDQDMGFDPTNAYPMGRLIGIQLIKAW